MHLGFLGRPVDRPGRCCYLMGEGQRGARRRLRSAISDLPGAGRGQPPAGLDYVKVPFQLPDKQSVTELIAVITARAGGEPVSLVVFDAAADFYGAEDNESSATDMNKMLMACKRISAELSCFVLLVAHTGHGATGQDEGDGARPGHIRGTSRFG
jgi:hypothetical protein